MIIDREDDTQSTNTNQVLWLEVSRQAACHLSPKTCHLLVL